MAPLQNVTIIGAGGQIGGVIAAALIKQGKHNVTAITRPDSTNKMPEGLHEVRKADYNDHSSLVEALKGQELLIITMNVMAPPESQKKLVDAAKDAGVAYIMPNEWGIDPILNEQLGKDVMLGERTQAMREYIEKTGLAWIGLSCSFWYEFSLSGSEARYGFDFKEKKLTYMDDGNRKIYTTTWPKVGLAVAKLLALPDFEQYKNKAVHISSFHISQRDMLASVLRVTGTKESDWTITYEDVQERFKRGQKMFSEGNFLGFGLLLYSRMFFPDGSDGVGDVLMNEKLGLPQEDLDEYTKIAVKYVESGEAAAWS